MTRHDYDMVFNDRETLESHFKCCHCGDVVLDMDTAMARQGQPCLTLPTPNQLMEPPYVWGLLALAGLALAGWAVGRYFGAW